jgi:hypothetical protein
MLERDLQKESCSSSKTVLVNRSNKARSSLLKDSETNGYERGTAGVDDGRYILLLNKEVVQQLIMMNVLLL